MNEDFLDLTTQDLIQQSLAAGVPINKGLMTGFGSQRNVNPFESLLIGMGIKKDPRPTKSQKLAAVQSQWQDLLKANAQKREQAEFKAAQQEVAAEQKAEEKAAKANQSAFEQYSALKALEPETVYKLGQVQQRLEAEGLPFDLYRQRLAGEEAARQTTAQLAATMPFLSAAGREATGRALAASERFLRTKEQMPTSVQNIMASKQSQMQSAQAGEAALMQAVAAQQQAAKDFAGKFAGQYIQVG
jgi:DNA polymerase III gamma/tau subunit